MADGLFSSLDLKSPGRAGYRLSHLEVFNWGTFDKRVWRLTPGGDTALLTGDIGSGKSTLVDAVTTLLLPSHRIAYNKAAGADARERTLRSYVEGHYKSERMEVTGASRAVGLRDHRAYSVILGTFVNEGFDETVTLAQVFHQKEKVGQPHRFFVTSTKALSIEDDFTDFGADLNDLRRRLRASGAEVHKDFPAYGRTVRRLLGIRSEQAMELLHQTVSMKSVGNLNEFVRNHMLEPADSADRIKAIVTHFEDLTKAHAAVKRAREQLEALSPLVATSKKYDETLARRTDTEHQRDAVRLYFAELRIRLLRGEIEATDTELSRQSHELRRLEQQRRTLTSDREALIEARAQAGGDRVAELERTAAAAREQAAERRGRRGTFDTRVAAAGLDPVTDAEGFASLTAQVRERQSRLEAEHDTVEAQRATLLGDRGDLRRRGEETRAELTSLASRKSNLPSSLLTIREKLCDELQLDESQLPFAGELLDVTEEFSEWRGAAERVLRGFAMSLLVPQRYYADVAQWVNQNRLTHRRSDGSIAGSRLVYERVPDRSVPLQSAPGDALRLADTIDVADGPFHDYLRSQLVHRADYRCVDTIEEFRHERRAVTREGQIRSGDRHEKDDRRRLDDARAWVLGWANERKVEALTSQLVEQQQALLHLDDKLERLKQEGRAATDTLAALSGLNAYSSWTELDWAEAEHRANAADKERQRLVAGSSALAEIERQLTDNTHSASDVDDKLRSVNREIAKLEDQIQRDTTAVEAEETFVAATPPEQVEAARASYDQLNDRLGSDVPGRAVDCQPVANRVTDELDASIKRINAELSGASQRLLQYMGEVRRRWPQETTEFDVSVESRTEFAAFHDRVANDDLPRFETEFKRQLNTNTIRELAGFNSWLRRQSDEIHTRVDVINEALGAIDYNPGRYVTLEAERTVNQEVQQFRADLRAATDDAVSPDDDHYSEQRFLDVQRIIERFQGRDGHTDADKAWTRRVTDVRNWFTFSASERDRETDEEWEHYRDSDGKSGGQKEKLAYTILAASLAYQFGLEWGAERSRDFRFAVIDEAFGRGSDVSTRYALDLFAKLGLQLLIVTPLQKVHVIAPYVHAIGFVDNPEGNYSRLQTLTIEEYHNLQAGRLA
ncbi:ATP-binding protein [Phytoactinopolyspora limicola]|uniref:ATP-binding protein n=1 Tax=Phytoactinopolyspora limicola TaxID=2715536 RepID=UPI00140A27F8|nr:SbcC/MukB-like Walker B domain-containing protein [Phytoactinopolyspora limicola]